MAKTPEELEKAQDDLGVALADLQTKIAAGNTPDAALLKDIADLKAAFAKLTPKKQEDPEPEGEEIDLFEWLKRFNPFEA